MAEVRGPSVPSLPTHLTKRIRSACDRCHSQKLRCRKLPDNRQCIRCAKAKAQCVFSPANRGFKSNPETEKAAQSDRNDTSITDSLPSLSLSSSPSSSSPSEHSEEHHETLNFLTTTTDPSADGSDIYTRQDDCTAVFDARNSDENVTFFEASNLHTLLPDVNNYDIGELDFSLVEDFSQTNTTLFPPTYNENSSMSSPLNLPGPSSTGLIPFITAGLYIQRLTDLSVNLYENAATLIPPRFNPVTALANPKWCKADGSDFPIDKTFSHTETLLGIMDEIFPRQQSTVPLHLSFAATNINEQNPLQHLILDPATMLLVFSCYVRLLDIYETLFEHVQICIEHLNGNERLVQPKDIQMKASVQVGCYNAENPMTTTLAILNILMSLSRQLLDRMRGISGSMGDSDGREPFVSRTGHAEFTETVFKSAEKRTHETSQKFNSVRMQLFQLGVL